MTNTKAARLNRECFCITLDQKALEKSLRDQFPDADHESSGIPELQHLFSNTAVFVPEADMSTMERIVQAIESATGLPGYQEQVLSWAPNIAGFDPGPIGAFMGYDFHLGPDGPQLIEINTNAGGAFLNAELARAQHQCCNPSQQSGSSNPALDGFEDAVFAMFKHEWQTQCGDSTPGRLAIVDNDPKSQFMFPEFQLAQRLLLDRGLDTLILDPSELEYTNGRLTADGKPIDMVYNRLVDFALEAPAHALLRQAYLDGAAVVTPNPRVHALLADKRNLTLLSAPQCLRDWGLNEADARYLEKAVPRTRLVSREDATALWEARRKLFFKPVASHGSKGVYRGDKMTRRVFENILEDDYIAQELVPAGERNVRIDDTITSRKVDIRLYTYAGKRLLAAARVYKGQTTNFRTPGGGFAPVFQV
ncbi:circularly permuted type 2 ATP-grasp protein [Halospina sp. K52047b]|uniref:circularly permuted type 2 ATP-grasp protein n=1 Tax=Halospina sp. K52047b TaxID=2614160 RepID=UPI001249D00C|nr:circularly permuted type 2 ATP-grasp protein [Halospina sp. K52047b]KAA8981979.1 circularly permuted type 2 ATP-grasp protein [Halospina sp. K52047b]